MYFMLHFRQGLWNIWNHSLHSSQGSYCILTPTERTCCKRLVKNHWQCSHASYRILSGNCFSSNPQCCTPWLSLNTSRWTSVSKQVPGENYPSLVPLENESSTKTTVKDPETLLATCDMFLLDFSYCFCPEKRRDVKGIPGWAGLCALPGSSGSLLALWSNSSAGGSLHSPGAYCTYMVVEWSLFLANSWYRSSEQGKGKNHIYSLCFLCPREWNGHVKLDCH